MHKYQFVLPAANHGSIAQSAMPSLKITVWQKQLKWCLLVRNARKRSGKICQSSTTVTSIAHIAIIIM